MRPRLEPWALGFLNLKPGPSLLKAQAKPCLGPGLRGPGRAGLRALSPARHITINDMEATNELQRLVVRGGPESHLVWVERTA